MEVFEHEHPLKLIDLQPEHLHYEEEYDEDDDKNEDLITKQDFRSPCDRCGKDITWFHRSFYTCTSSCGYSLHKFCAELPPTLKHTSHDAHTLILLRRDRGWTCDICRSHHEPQDIRYRCSPCDFDVDVNCATASVEHWIIHHPSHPHPLVPAISKPILCKCDACGKEHKGIFYRCITCFHFAIHNDCALLPEKLLIQQITNDVFSHTHPLILSYSFPKADQRAKFHPSCWVCGNSFYGTEHLWIYKCEKCRYYAHLDCATSRGEPLILVHLLVCWPR